MPREFDGPARGPRRERDAPAEGRTAQGFPHEDTLSSSVRENIRNSRAHSRSEQRREDVPARDSLRDGSIRGDPRDARGRDDDSGARRSFVRPRQKPPKDAPAPDAAPAETFGDDGSAGVPVLDDIARARGDRETSGPAKTGSAQKRARLNFTREDAPPEPKTPSDKAAAARHRADKAEAKLAKARENLPQKHTPKIEIPFDEQKKKTKRKLVFEQEAKSKQARLKGSPVTRPVKAGARTVVYAAHRKIHAAEHENVGVEAGHKTELAAEGGLRAASRHRKLAPYRKAEKLQKKTARLSAKAGYQKALADNPRLKKSLWSRLSQKRKIRKAYAKKLRDAQRATRRAKEAGATTRAIFGFIRRHPVLTVILVGLALLILVIISLFGAFGSMASSGGGAIAATSYLAADADIDAAELLYTEMETDLHLEAMNAETSHPGFDEYRYSVANIGHGPHELMAYLTAAHGEFTFAGIGADLHGIFAEQYTLTFTEEVEIRARMVQVYDPGTGTYIEIEEEYEWHILNVTLTARSFTDVIMPKMDEEQSQRYALLTRVKGNRQYVGSPFSFNWLPYVSDGYGWRVHPISGNKDNHRGVDIAVASGTEILAAHDGTVSFAGDNGSYGLVVFLTGEDGVETRYAHCSQLLVAQGQSVAMGDVIAKVGSTGDSTGPHLHFEVLKDGAYLSPLYFAFTNDDGSSAIPPGMPGGAAIPASPGAPMDGERFAAMLEVAQAQIGKSYVFGSAGLDTFDCSGFVSYVLAGSIYPGFAHTTAQGLYNICTPVSRADAQPGDLVFFTATYNAGRPVTHVGLYLGNGQMLHAGDPVQYASIDIAYWQEHFYAFGRLP